MVVQIDQAGKGDWGSLPDLYLQTIGKGDGYMPQEFVIRYPGFTGHASNPGGRATAGAQLGDDKVFIATELLQQNFALKAVGCDATTAHPLGYAWIVDATALAELT